MREYNQIVRLFQAKDWKRLDDATELFRKVYESSPLLEPITFIEVQSQFERIKEFGSRDTKEAEQKLRNAFLLYPRSSFIPGMTSNMAYFWMRHSQNRRALATYESLFRSYPKHELACVFLSGLGESFYQLRDWKQAQERYQKVLKDCKNKKRWKQYAPFH